MTASTCAPAQGLPETGTVHVYADACYGDDIKALAANPGLPGTGSMLQQHPGDPANIPGHLFQAPFAFRTITAAVAYAASLQPGGSGPVEFVVVHVAPGLYGPAVNPDPQTGLEIDLESGLPWSGEAMPIFVPDRVSIQGTSALDTIVDARRQEDTSVLRMKGFSVLETYEFTFVDALTIRGARGPMNAVGSRHGCGIVIEGERPITPAVSNCFFTDNHVGIAIVTDDANLQEPLVHFPRIANNTFVFNQVGIWNGTWQATPSGLREGVNKPAVVNNVFDTSTPATGARPGTLAGISTFEGFAADDTNVQLGPGSADVNAYEATAFPARFNLGNSPPVPWPLQWPRTVTRLGAAPPASPPLSPLPQVDLTPFTNPAPTLGAASANRGALYIADVFRIDASTHVAGNPRSRHDFRLSPVATTSSTATSGVDNPLLNAGIGGPSVTITCVNGNGPGSLGLPAGSAGPDPQASISGWDWDCEGAYNPRVATKDFVFVPGPFGLIDLGADEMGAVIISGYLDNTRIFSRLHDQTPLTRQRDRLFFFNRFRGAGTFYIRPQFVFSLDAAHPTMNPAVTSRWYDQLLNHPYQAPPPRPVNPLNYTDGAFDPNQASTVRIVDVQGTLINPPFMRNLECDIAPHLYPANTPRPGWTWFPMWSDDPIVAFFDPFQANPWFNQGNLADAFKDNPRLYFHTASGSTPRLAMLSPPLTVNAGDVQPESFLFSHVARPAPNPYPDPVILNWNNNPGLIYTVNPLGWGDTFATETVPFFPGEDFQGYRVDVELFSPADEFWDEDGTNATHNLQTFLVVQGGDGEGEPVPPEMGLQLDRSGAVSALRLGGNPLTVESEAAAAADRAAVQARLDEELRALRGRR